MSITRLAVNNSRITLLAVIGIILVGLQTYLHYPSAEDPTIQIREAQVVANYPGMSAEQVENLITKLKADPLAISAEEPFPVDLTLSKTYDRFFDGIDFDGFDSADMDANIMAVLELETRVAFGTRVSAQ